MHECVGALIIEQASILLGKRSAQREFYPDVWDVFGGHVEADESPEQALERELREELGILLVCFRYLETLITSVPGNREHLECRLYVVTEWRGTPSNLQPQEHTRIGWFRFEDALKLDLAASEYRRIIESLHRPGSSPEP
jgi:mutator protein MutT